MLYDSIQVLYEIVLDFAMFILLFFVLFLPKVLEFINILMFNLFSDIQDDELLDWFEKIFNNEFYQITYNIEECDPKTTISFVSDLRISQDFKNKTDKLNQLQKHSKNSKIVFVRETEINQAIHDLIKSSDYDNVFWLLPGQIKGFKNIIFYNWHVNLVRELYTNHNHVLDTLNPFAPKSKYFDALLGTKKKHRDIVYQELILHKDKNIIKYHGNFNTKSLIDTEHFVWDIDTKKSDITHSTSNVDYCGQSVRLSHIIPKDVYNQTCYSIVTETFFDNSFSFYTEKIAKPIIAKRLFVVFAGQHYLKNLKLLGFKTFQNVIDESYDEIENDLERFTMALEQVKKLMVMDQSEVLNQIQHICEYNYNFLISNQTQANMFDNIKKIIYD
jgi:hypothetical protein